MVGDNFYDSLYSRIGYIIDRYIFGTGTHFFRVAFIIKNIHVDERRRCVNFISHVEFATILTIMTSGLATIRRLRRASAR